MQVARLSRDELAIRKAILAYGAALEMFIPGAACSSQLQRPVGKQRQEQWQQEVLQRPRGKQRQEQGQQEAS